MKKQIFIILAILLTITIIAGYYVYNITRQTQLAEINNKKYTKYYGQEVLGTTLISIINNAINDNENNAIDKKDNTIYYEDNGEDSIQISVKFLEDDRIIQMEDIAEKETENFVKFFATATFKCTKIEYHQKTNLVKSLHFEQI